MIRETTAPQDIVWLKIDEVYPYECNNKIHRQPEITKIANSIKEFGWTYPILIDENNIVLAGHKRLQAAKQIGLTEVPTIRKDDLSDAQKRAYRIIDNKSSEESEYDPTNLTLELDEIKALDFDISKFINLNFDLDKIGETQDLDTQEDDYDAEPPAEPKTKYGDIYQLGNHRLMCGDSTKEEDIEKLMNGQLADMIFTDPPYGVCYTGGVVHGSKINVDHKREMLKNDDADIYSKFIPIINSVIKDGAIYIFYATRNSYELLKPLHDNNIELNSIIVWNKINTGYADLNSHYKNKYEPCVYCKRKGHKLNFVGDSSENTVWEVNKDRNNILHPTQKPIELAARAIRNSSLNGNIVLDFFGGSGSTLIACEQLNRNCYMMELDPVYCDVIIDRWEKFTGQKAQKIEG